MKSPIIATFVTLISLFLVSVILVLPGIFGVKASSDAERGLANKTSRFESFPNYDIRTDKANRGKLDQFRTEAGRSAVEIADIKDRFVRGENRLKASIPALAVEYSDRLQSPEVISTKAGLGSPFLTRPSGGKRSDLLRRFIDQNPDLFGSDETFAATLNNSGEQQNPEGAMSFATVSQEIDGVPVFQGTITAGFTRKGEIVRVINNLTAVPSDAFSNSDFGDAASLLPNAASYIGHELRGFEKLADPSASTDKKKVFGNGDWATIAEKVYFPTEPGVIVPAWKVLFWLPDSAFYVIVDASKGDLLWRKYIGAHQSQPATYNVFANPNAMIPVADSPNPITPGPLSPVPGTQGARIPRTSITRIGNEPPYTFNNLGWITDGNNETDGNAVEAGVDRELPNGVDPMGKAVGSPNRAFDFPFNPSNPSGVPDAGEGPLPPGTTITPCVPAGTSPPLTDFQKATVTQLFYISNWFHDEMYRLGFTEAARNFQHDNFGRGGLGEDRVSAEAQECTGTNGGNFFTPADGQRPRLQLFIWTLPEPDHDGALDADVAIHELVHGLSNRLHGNASGLTTNMARSMGEGWSDLYAHAMLSEPSDPINGIYTIAAYSFYRPLQPHNGYYGIRRFPKAVISSTGGPQDRPHNPLTFADIDSTQINLTDGAFPSNPNIGGSADQVHNAGEVWSAALWEIRAKYIQRLGWADGNRRFLQHVTDGMKLSPLAPTFLQARDAVIFAALAGGASDDVGDAWAGFAIRGMGASASIQNQGSGTGNARVTEAFDTPNLTMAEPLQALDHTGNINGYPEPGEPVILRVPVANFSGTTATNVTVQLVGGGSVSLGTIAAGGTAIMELPHTIPTATACGSAVQFNFDVNSSLGPVSFSRTLNIGVPNITFQEDFDGVSAPNFPAEWTAVPVSGGINFVNAPLNPNSPPNAAFALNPDTVGGGTDLTSPPIAINASAATVRFEHSFLTEAGWDGGVLELSIGGGPFQDVAAAGGNFIYGNYNGTLGANGVNNPLAGRQAWTGNSNGYSSDVLIRLPAAANGQNVQLRWRFGADNNTAPANGGWSVDDIDVVGSYTCSFITAAAVRADYDGDGRTDVSVFRPSDGNWYLDRSTDGFIAVNFGVADDIITPGDFDGDEKTDIAVFRPSTGQWFILDSSGGFSIYQFGQTGDIPVPGDFDGDGRDDIAVFRPSTSVWYAQLSGGGFAIAQFGAAGDIPLRGDFDGDGRADLAVYRSGQWWIARSSGGFSVDTFGFSTDEPVPADYDGDGRDDIAVFRPADGVWYIYRSSDQDVSFIPFGISTDIPAPGDFDGDGKADQAIYRDGVWFINRSSAGILIQQFGLAADRPTPGGYIP